MSGLSMVFYGFGAVSSPDWREADDLVRMMMTAIVVATTIPIINTPTTSSAILPPTAIGPKSTTSVVFGYLKSTNGFGAMPMASDATSERSFRPSTHTRPDNEKAHSSHPESNYSRRKCERNLENGHEVRTRERFQYSDTPWTLARVRAG